MMRWSNAIHIIVFIYTLIELMRRIRNDARQQARSQFLSTRLTVKPFFNPENRRITRIIPPPLRSSRPSASGRRANLIS